MFKREIQLSVNFFEISQRDFVSIIVHFITSYFSTTNYKEYREEQAVFVCTLGPEIVVVALRNMFKQSIR